MADFTLVWPEGPEVGETIEVKTPVGPVRLFRQRAQWWVVTFAGESSAGVMMAGDPEEVRRVIERDLARKMYRKYR